MLLCLLFFILSGIVGRSGSFEVTITPLTNPTYEMKGGSLSLRCIVDEEIEEGQEVWTWSKNGAELPRTTDHEFGEANLKDLQVSDSGNYTCSVSVRDGPPKSKTMELVVYEMPTFEGTEPTQHPLLHTDSIISCKVKSNLNLHVRWTKDGNRLKVETRYVIQSDGLLIKNLTEKDNGEYQCLAELLQVGKKNVFDIKVEAYEAPRIWSSKGLVRVNEDSTASITCSATGIPTPTYNFYKDDDKTPIEETSEIKVDKFNGKLWWNKVVLQDAGNYTCVAVNEVGADPKLNRLYVMARPKVTQFEDATFYASEGYEFNCTATGYPAPFVTLYRISEDVETIVATNDGKEGDSSTTVTYKEKGKMDIAEYIGDFACAANNSIGQARKTAYMDLLYAPVFSIRPPTEQYILVNHSTNVTFQVFSNPAPSFVWTKDSTKIEEGETFEIFNISEGRVHKSVLQISPSADESGEYVCEIKNDLGAIKGPIKVREAVVPEAPKSLEIYEISPTYIVLGIEDGSDGGYAIFKYNIKYNARGTSDSQVVEIAKMHKILKDEPTLIKIEKLSPNTEYDFHIAGINLVGVGRSSNIFGKTKEMRVPDQVVVEKQKEDCLNPQNVIIKWQEPYASGAVVEKYRIKYREVTTAGASKQWITKETTESKYKLEGLTSPEYEVQVDAKNVIGWSQDSEPKQINICKGALASHSHSTGWLLGIVFAVVVVVCIIVDLVCYAVNGCGVTKLICNKVNSKKHKNKEYGDTANKEEREFLNMGGEKTKTEKQPTQV